MRIAPGYHSGKRARTLVIPGVVWTFVCSYWGFGDNNGLHIRDKFCLRHNSSWMALRLHLLHSNLVSTFGKTQQARNLTSSSHMWIKISIIHSVHLKMFQIIEILFAHTAIKKDVFSEVNLWLLEDLQRYSNWIQVDHRLIISRSPFSCHKHK